MDDEDDFDSEMESFVDEGMIDDSLVQNMEEVAEMSIAEKNRRNFPYHRALFNAVDIETLERVNFSYVKIPDDYPIGESTGRKNCPISHRELNNKYIGVAQHVRADFEGMTDNDCKHALLKVSPKTLSELDLKLFLGSLSDF